MLLRILFSKWLLYGSTAAAIAALYSHNPILRTIVFAWFGLIVVLQLIYGLIGMLRVHGAWRKFPDTPEYEEYAQRKETENDKNKLEIK